MVQHPPQHVGVVRHAGGHHDEKEPSHVAAAREAAPFERTHRAAAGVPAQRPLRDERGDAHQHDGEQVEEDEGGAAELPDHVGKAPDVPESRGDPDHGEERAEPRREALPDPASFPGGRRLADAPAHSRARGYGTMCSHSAASDRATTATTGSRSLRLKTSWGTPGSMKMKSPASFSTAYRSPGPYS